MYRHINVVHGNPNSFYIKCQICQKEFKNKYNLNVHLNIHSENFKGYTC